MQKQYVLWNYGSYVSSYDKSCCSWTFLKSCAMVFNTYSKAYSAMKSVNNSYGHGICRVMNYNNPNL